MSAARPTKAQLAAELEAERVAYQALRSQYESLQGELHEMRGHLFAMKKVAPVMAITTPYREALAKAKALALSTGRCVNVGQ